MWEITLMNGSLQVYYQANYFRGDRKEGLTDQIKVLK